MNSEPRSWRLRIAYPVACPRRSATRLPVGRERMSPCQGSHASKTWWRMPVPRVSVRNSVRKPTSPRAGTRYSILAHPLPAALPQREQLRDDADVLLGNVDRDPLDRFGPPAVELLRQDLGLSDGQLEALPA